MVRHPRIRLADSSSFDQQPVCGNDRLAGYMGDMRHWDAGVLSEGGLAA